MINNWNDVKQELIDELASIKKDAKGKLLNSISNDIQKASNNTIIPSIVKGSVRHETKNLTEAQNGQIYFDMVFKNIDQSYIDKNT